MAWREGEEAGAAWTGGDGSGLGGGRCSCGEGDPFLQRSDLPRFTWLHLHLHLRCTSPSPTLIAAPLKTFAMALSAESARRRRREAQEEQAARAAAGQPRKPGRPRGRPRKKRGLPRGLAIYNAKKRAAQAAARAAAGIEPAAPAVPETATTPKLRSVNGHEAFLRKISPLLAERFELPTQLPPEVLRDISTYCGPMKKVRPRPEGPPRRSGRERKSTTVFEAAPAVNESKSATGKKAWATRRDAQWKKENELRVARMQAEEARKLWLGELGRQAREGRAKIPRTSHAPEVVAPRKGSDSTDANDAKQAPSTQHPTKTTQSRLRTPNSDGVLAASAAALPTE